MEDNFFSKRRSVLAKKMMPNEIIQSDIDKILAAGIRVPDHGALNPWKIKVIIGEKLKKIDEGIILSEFKKQNPNANQTSLEIESKRLQRASVVFAVISTPVEHPKIPKWEMYLSCGALCQNLLNASIALGYGAQWVTEWYSYNKKLLQILGGDSESEKFAGFIYIGKMLEKPIERRRADLDEIVTNIKL